MLGIARTGLRLNINQFREECTIENILRWCAGAQSTIEWRINDIRQLTGLQ